MIRAIIFDLDGTLSYTLDSIAISGNKALNDMGMPSYETDRYKYFCGDGADELVRRILINNGDTLCEHFDEAKKLYAKYFAMYANYKVAAYENMPKTLAALKERGYKLAVLTNKPHQQAVEVIEKLYGKDMFDYIQGNVAEIKRKPSPEGAFIIAKKLSILEEDFLYVGDTATDMNTGNDAGMHTIGVLWGYRSREELIENNAEYIIDNPEQILDIIDGKISAVRKG